jgi:hypothetical protein
MLNMRSSAAVRQKRLRVSSRALAFAACVAWACGGSNEPPRVESVRLTPPNRTILVGPGGGETLLLTAAGLDGDGVALANRTVTWVSSAPSVARVVTTGLVTAVSPGVATITATIDGITGTAQITVNPVPVATIVLTPALDSVIIGQSRQLTVAVRDSAGNALTDRTVQWNSSSSALATVSNTGVVTTVAVGDVIISASSEGKTGNATIVVLPSQGPVLTGVTPTVLTPGATATITGSRFGELPVSNTLTVRGKVVPVLTATPTQLTFTVPCLRNGAAPILVTTSGGASSPLASTITTTRRTLAVGGALILTDSASSACNELDATGTTARYFVVAYSAATSQNTLIDLELGGNDALSATTAQQTVTPSAIRRAPPSANTEESARERAHFEHLERERQLYQSLRGTVPTARTGAVRNSALSANAQRSMAPPPVLGDMRTLYFNFNGCSDSTKTIRGRVIYAGTRAIIWEDSANTLQSTVDTPLAGYYQRLGQIFDLEQYDVVRTTFGDPLRRDPLTDNDGRVHMVFTQQLNGTGAAAYVTSCDQSPRNTTTRAASNFGEFFYGTVPVSAGANVNSTNFSDGWFYFMARTVIHEVKHIASQAARFENNAPTFEQSWLEEGTARHAEEVWVRSALHHVPWKGNTGYGTAATNGIYCDFNPSVAACLAADTLRRPSYGMRRQFNEIRPKLLDPWDWSPFGDGTNQSGAVFYQTTWSLVRYTIDRFGTSDAAFLTTLTNAVTSGVTNLSNTAGAPFNQILGGWGLSLIADDYPGVTSLSPDAAFPTWNLRNIYSGLNMDPAWGSRFNTPYPIVPTTLGFGAFSVQRSAVRGGAHVYYELFGSFTQPQLLHLRGFNGAPMPGNARLAIVRVQ